MAIFDLAKTTIYDFHYEYMDPIFDNDCTLLYTDKDSLIYEIRNRDYDIVLDNDILTKKPKGSSSVIKNKKINFEDYVQCFENYICKNVSQNLIKSDKHRVFSITQNKLALRPHDDKLYFIAISYETLPWGRYSIMDVDMLP
ncbi:hypothetical protein NQ318_014137 [Aromia moschata]|uniref:Uncharacterized protein n=1 Tax=Aromia moschata TaxID=1265417 RepID=A0AAV8XNE6_9CUCU|nr:hypothetical protein NQ318_014137 [Aromia moschata]